MDKKAKAEKTKKTPTGSPAQPPLPFRPEKPMTDLSELLAVHLRPLVEQMTTVNAKLDSLQLQMHGLMQDTQLNSESTQKLSKKVEKCEKTAEGILKDKELMERQLIQLQMEKASFYLRFQGVPEHKDEDLNEIVTRMLAEGADISEREMEKEIDIIYRTHTAYVKRNKLPGEVLVRFSRRQMRDQILRSVRSNPLKIGDQMVETLKDIPFEVRKRRKQYRPLALFLQQKKITYRWCYPEGLIFTYKGQKMRIDTEEKRKDFLDLQKKQTQKKQREPAKEKGSEGDVGKQDAAEDKESASGTCSDDSDQELGAAAPRTHRDRQYELRQREKR